jgi:hypothetical protein
LPADTPMPGRTRKPRPKVDARPDAEQAEPSEQGRNRSEAEREAAVLARQRARLEANGVPDPDAVLEGLRSGSTIADLPQRVSDAIQDHYRGSLNGTGKP